MTSSSGGLAPAGFDRGPLILLYRLAASFNHGGRGRNGLGSAGQLVTGTVASRHAMAQVITAARPHQQGHQYSK